MGKHHKNKHRAAPAKDLSEADAAAGAMAATPSEDNNATSKRARDSIDKPTDTKLTRKEKRQKLNDKNKWPQHPKIVNPEQRAKAYLRVAGIETIDEDATNVPTSPTAAPEDETEWRRFGRFLGGSDARTRHKAVKRLTEYLQLKSGHGQENTDDVVGLSELDLLKLWKGLWFTLYMADKVPVQDELAKHIAKLLWCVAGSPEEDEFAAQAYLDMEAEEALKYEQQQREEEEDSANDEDDEDFKILETRRVVIEDENNEDEEEEDEEEMEDPEQVPHIRGVTLAMLMIRTFFRTLVREWGNLDKYRIDKFYTLVRYTLREVFKYMAERQWSLGVIRFFNDAIAEEALMKRPNGVRYHLLDIALEELSVVAHKENVLPVTEAIFLEVLEPYLVMTQHGFGDKTVQARAVEKVLEKFLFEYSAVRGEPDDDKKKAFEDVHVGTISQAIFEMASSEEALDIHRKTLYDMHKTYTRQIKKTGTDIEINSAFRQSEEDEEDVEDEDDEDYPEEMELAEDEEDDLEQMGFVAEEDESEADDDANKQSAKAVVVPVQETKKKKKKDKKKRKDDEAAIGSSKAEDATTSDSPRDDKKKEKATTKIKGEMDLTQHVPESRKDKKSKKKKKKKKRDDNKDDADKDGEQVVTISVAEQKKAKQSLLEDGGPPEEASDDQASKKKKKKKEGGEKRKKLKRRVSFDGQNRARSWKASMQGLRTLDPTEAASKTPEKSILLNKGKTSPRSQGSGSSRKKQRKRAVDYF